MPVVAAAAPRPALRSVRPDPAPGARGACTAGAGGGGAAPQHPFAAAAANGSAARYRYRYRTDRASRGPVAALTGPGTARPAVCTTLGTAPKGSRAHRVPALTAPAPPVSPTGALPCSRYRHCPATGPGAGGGEQPPH